MFYNSFILIILCFYFIGCTRTSEKSLDDKIESTTEENLSCLNNLYNQDELTQWAYNQAFTMFGAVLLKYQEILRSNKSVGDEFHKINIGALSNELQSKNKTYFGTPINAKFIGDLADIESKITDKKVREIWLSWCAHPDNFISWLVGPVYWIKANNIEDLMKSAVGDNLKQNGRLLHWFDDGFWMISNILGIKIGPSHSWTADPTKWLIEIKDNKAITR